MQVFFLFFKKKSATAKESGNGNWRGYSRDAERLIGAFAEADVTTGDTVGMFILVTVDPEGLKEGATGQCKGGLGMYKQRSLR